MKITKRQHIIGTTLLVVWIGSWIFARDIVRWLESLDILPRRGLVFSDASDFAFSLAVVALGFCLWAIAAVFVALSGRGAHERTAVVADADPRYVELTRQKELLLRELKELEFDRHLRKISDEDYAVIEGRMRQRATKLLRSLDELDPVRLYADRIREDLKKYELAAPPLPRADAAPPSAAPAAAPWKTEILAQPLYRELAPLLGERELLLAALCGFYIVAAEVDRGELSASSLTIDDRRSAGRARFTTSLAGLRVHALDALRNGLGHDEGLMRLAELVGVPAESATASELRARVVAALSRDVSVGAAA